MNGVAGTANTGGGGGGGGTAPPGSGPTGIGAAGGSGVVVLRISATDAPGSLAVAPGTNTLTTLPAPAGGCKVARFTVSGTLTV